MFSFCSVHFFPQKPSFQTNHGTTDMIHSCSCQSVHETLDLKFLQMVRPVPHIISRRHWCVTVCVNGWMRGKICKAPQNNKCSIFIWEVKLKMLGGKKSLNLQQTLSKDGNWPFCSGNSSQVLTLGCLASVNPSARCNLEYIFIISTAFLLLFRGVECCSG